MRRSLYKVTCISVWIYAFEPGRVGIMHSETINTQFSGSLIDPAVSILGHAAIQYTIFGDTLW